MGLEVFWHRFGAQNRIQNPFKISKKTIEKCMRFLMHFGIILGARWEAKLPPKSVDFSVGFLIDFLMVFGGASGAQMALTIH